MKAALARSGYIEFRTPAARRYDVTIEALREDATSEAEASSLSLVCDRLLFRVIDQVVHYVRGRTLGGWVKTSLFAVLFSFACIEPVIAAVIGTPPAYGGPSQKTAVCYYSNVGASGSGSITFSFTGIFQGGGGLSQQAVNNCSSLAPSKSCRVVANNLPGIAHWCEAEVNAKQTLRLRLEIRDSNGNVLTDADGR